MMTKHCLLTVLLALAWLIPAAAKSPDILAYEHENLKSGKTETLNAMRGESSFLLFFQPDCKWCLKQSQALDKLLSACPNKLNAVALGVHASRHELKKELRRLRPDYPAYKTGDGMLADLAGVPATPVMLLADERGGFVQSFRGYIPPAQLAVILDDNHGVRCAL